MKNINELAKEYDELCEKTRSCAEELAKLIAETCKPVIKDLSIVGPFESSTNRICFYSYSYSISRVAYKDLSKYIFFDDLLEEVIPQLKGHVDCPLGSIWLTKEEANKIKNLLSKKLKKSKR